MQNVIYEPLKRLGIFAHAEGHEGDLEEAEWSGNGGLLYIIGMDGNLIVCSHQVDLAEDGTTEKLLGVIMYMMDGVVVRALSALLSPQGCQPLSLGTMSRPAIWCRTWLWR
jgi:hypothetical protein